jgi:hypothetical protein
LEEEGEPLSDWTTTPTVEHGGGNNLMVWDCMGWNGVGVFTEVQEIINGEQYCEILNRGMVESFEKLEMPKGERTFQHDNDPKHISNRANQVGQKTVSMSDYFHPDWGHMKANMVYYQVHLFQSNTFAYHCVINQTLEQFFEQL